MIVLPSMTLITLRMAKKVRKSLAFTLIKYVYQTSNLLTSTVS